MLSTGVGRAMNIKDGLNLQMKTMSTIIVPVGEKTTETNSIRFFLPDSLLPALFDLT